MGERYPRVAKVAAEAEKPKPDPIAVLAALHRAGEGLNEDAAGSYLADVRKDRQRWRGVICLDTNGLIRGLVVGSSEASALTAWVRCVLTPRLPPPPSF